MNRARIVTLTVVGLLLAAQLLRPALTNPPVVAEPHWDSPRTRELVRQACFDCHSNETRSPWYAQVAPARWLIAHHVEEGREHLNFSDPASEYDLDDMVKAIRSGEMPTWDYKLLHGAARLTSAERDTLVAGLTATFSARSGAEGVSDPQAGAHKDAEERDDDAPGERERGE